MRSWIFLVLLAAAVSSLPRSSMAAGPSGWNVTFTSAAGSLATLSGKTIAVTAATNGLQGQGSAFGHTVVIAVIGDGGPHHGQMSMSVWTFYPQSRGFGNVSGNPSTPCTITASIFASPQSTFTAQVTPLP